MLKNASNIRNNKGMTLIETAVTIVIFSMTIYMVNSFSIFLASHKSLVADNIAFSHVVESEIANMYNNANWDGLDNYEYIVKDDLIGDVSIKLMYAPTRYNTEKLSLEFTNNDKSIRKYNIEKSDYHEQ